MVVVALLVVNGDTLSSDYWITIATAGTVETVPVTATTCTATSNGASGTVTFATGLQPLRRLFLGASWPVGHSGSDQLLLGDWLSRLRRQPVRDHQRFRVAGGPRTPRSSRMPTARCLKRRKEVKYESWTRGSVGFVC